MSRIILINSANLMQLPGGSMIAVEHISRFFSDKGFEVINISWNYKNSKILIYEKNGIKKIFITDIRKHSIKFFLNLNTIINLIKKITNKNYYLWIHSPLPWALIKLFNKKNCKKNIYTIHGPLKAELNYNKAKSFILNFLFNILLKYAVRESDLIQFNSEYIKSESLRESHFLNRYNHLVEEILINENEVKNNLRNIPNVNHYGDYFLIPRRLIKRTGVYEFLELIKTNYSFYSKYKFVITGYGELEKKIISIASQLPNVIYLGNVDENVMLNLKYYSKAIIIPSLNIEGFCVVAKEARILKKCILHTNQGGLKEALFNYSNQHIFDINNSISLIKCLENSSKNIVQFNHARLTSFEHGFEYKISKLGII